MLERERRYRRAQRNPELQAAEQDSWSAQIEHDRRIYVHARGVRALALAANRNGR